MLINFVNSFQGLFKACQVCMRKIKGGIPFLVVV